MEKKGMCIYSVSKLEETLVCVLSCVQHFVTPWPGSSVHGIYQTRILECVAISFSRGSS